VAEDDNRNSKSGEPLKEKINTLNQAAPGNITEKE
jgi:hypothetical protein